MVTRGLPGVYKTRCALKRRIIKMKIIIARPDGEYSQIAGYLYSLV